MKILNINSYYYSSTVHKQLQKALFKEQLNSYTYVFVSRGHNPREECQYEKDDYIKKVECYNKIDRLIFHFKHRKVLNNIIKEIELYKYDCLHAHSLFSNGYIAMKIKDKFKKPYIVTIRNTDLNTFFKKMIHLRGLGNRILREADKVVFVSNSYRDNLIDKYIEKNYKDSILAKSYVIPSGIDSFWLENKGFPKALKSKKNIKLLYVGAVNKSKNILTTIKAIEVLKKKNYEVNLTVIGKIVDEGIYNEIIKYDFVKYISPKLKEKILKIYQNNDIFVMPSITETFGLVYPEAMSQGLPVIYTRGQGFDRQFQDGEVGFSVDCFNIHEIAEKIIAIANNYKNLSKRCINLCDKFDWNEIATQYKGIYSNIIDGGY